MGANEAMFFGSFSEMSECLQNHCNGLEGPYPAAISLRPSYLRTYNRSVMLRGQLRGERRDTARFEDAGIRGVHPMGDHAVPARRPEKWQ